ncbi:MAG: hypothetical protein JO287_27470 [Pseudonocardiales bacterium]|nr:hypothetical protein [Pseudonocardiales bacterium]
MNRWLFGPGLGLVAAVAVTVSACGNASTSTAGQPAEPSSPPAAPAGPPGASGTVAAVTASSIQVQNPRIGQVTVTFTPSTSFTTTGPATAADLVVGNCALALGAPQTAGDQTGPVTATSVLISTAAADGGCTAGGFGGQGRGARAGSPGSNARVRGAATSGKITSISGDGFVMQMGTSKATRTVTTTQTTTFSRTVATDHSALAVGQCVTAVGPSDDTGTVAASSISARQPGPNGCQGGFGGPGRAGSGAPSTGSNGRINGA